MLLVSFVVKYNHQFILSMSGDITKIPPQNLEAESSLLGAILMDKETLMKVADIVVADDFYKDAHQLVFEAMTDLSERREPIDILSVGNRLEETKKLEAAGGRSYLLNLVNSVPTSANAVHYAQIIQKKSTLRRLLKTSSEIQRLGYNEEDDVDVVLDQAEKSLFNVTQKFLRQAFVSLRHILNDAFERIDEMHRNKGKLRGVPTGFPGLDNILGGLIKSNLIILAARPSVGKTSLALDIARNAAVRAKVPVGIFSLEMSKEELVDKILCAEAGVSMTKMRSGHLNDRSEDDDFPRIGAAMGALSDAPIFIDESSSNNIMQIRLKARRLQAEHGLGLLIIDYLQLMESRTRTENRVQEISEITRSLKNLARELNVPILALSQLSRATEQQTGPAIPRLSHLRESGSIEQDADVVMFIYRKATDPKYRANPDSLPPHEKHLAEIRIEKHRNGPANVTVNLYFDEECASFRPLETNMKPEDYGVPL